MDVFAQIAASAHPLPVEQPAVRRASIATTSSIVQKSQSQLAQTIYQNQQALRLQQQQKPQQQPVQKRDSIDSTISKFDPKIYDEDMDDYDEEDFDSNSDEDEPMNIKFGSNNISNGSNTSLKFESAIAEETETDLQMDIDQSINFQRRRSPSLSDTNDININPQPFYGGRRLSAPENVSNYSGYSTRRVIHNICERKRRENIREGFDQLQSRLPPHLANNSKLSKMEILTGAKNLINEIRGRISNLSAEVSALSQVTEQMEKKKITETANANEA